MSLPLLRWDVLRRLVFLLIAGGMLVAFAGTAQPVQAQPVTVPMTEEAQTRIRAASQRASAQDASDVRPHRYGVVLPVQLSSASDGSWSENGAAATWTLDVTSPGARSVSLRFSRFTLPPGAHLTVEHPDGEVTHGPYRSDRAAQGRFWTPLVPGASIRVRLRVPPSQRSRVHVQIDGLVHGDQPFPAPTTAPKATAKSGACNVDVACSEADPWRPQVRSVGHYTYEKNGIGYVCSGTLVNNTALDRRPLFLTAEHCVGTDAVAASMVFYWNFESPTCRAPGSSASGRSLPRSQVAQTSTGATLLATIGNAVTQGRIRGKPDLTLVEVSEAIPASYDLFYSGWNRSGRAPQSSVTIHHPRGDAKRIAVDEDPATVTGYLSDNGVDDTHFRVGNWEAGTTEGGSSGSPLFDENGYVTGVLSGGYAGCTFGSPNDNDRPDWYGRLSEGWTAGDAPAERLAPWLDPVDLGVETLNGIDVNVLPVDLAGFSAVATESAIELSWVTASETNNAGFAIERAQGDTGFKRLDAFVNGQGSTSTATRYRYTIDAPIPGRYRVRLVQVDLGGTETVVARGEVTVRAMGVDVSPVFPTPTRANGRLRVAVEQSAPVRVVIYDALGRRLQVVFDETLPANVSREVPLPTGRLAPGRYFVRVTAGPHTTTRPLVVVR